VRRRRSRQPSTRTKWHRPPRDRRRHRSGPCVWLGARWEVRAKLAVPSSGRGEAASCTPWSPRPCGPDGPASRAPPIVARRSLRATSPPATRRRPRGATGQPDRDPSAASRTAMCGRGSRPSSSVRSVSAIRPTVVIGRFEGVTRGSVTQRRQCDDVMTRLEQAANGSDPRGHAEAVQQHGLLPGPPRPGPARRDHTSKRALPGSRRRCHQIGSRLVSCGGRLGSAGSATG
jgi:hypothetical protein